MALKAALREAMKAALRAKEQLKLDTIRGVLSEIQYEEIQKKADDLPDEDILAVIKREIKKRNEEVEFAEKASRPDLQEKARAELAALEVFLPRQLSAEELRGIIGELKAENVSLNLGGAMKILKERYAGQYDSKLASEIARDVLS